MTSSPKHGLVLAGSVVFVLPTVLSNSKHMEHGCCTVVEMGGYVTAQLEPSHGPICINNVIFK